MPTFVVMASNSGNSNPKSKVHQAKGQATNPTAADHQLPEDGDENQYFYEDEVFCIDGKGRVKFGVVLEVEFSEGEEGFEEDALKKGEIRACWHPDGQIEVVKQCKVSGDGCGQWPIRWSSWSLCVSHIMVMKRIYY